jgi:Abnormal spindle-like microcephaly-assoc'd, ASPM-SPD-2-Hydin
VTLTSLQETLPPVSRGVFAVGQNPPPRESDHAARIEVFVKDLHPRWKLLVAVLILSSIFGCTALEARPQDHPESSSLAASDFSMDFGTVAVGGTAAQASYISNPSNADVTIGKAITSGSYFQVVSPRLPVTIPAGQRARFVVKFVPNREGRLRGRITIWSSSSQSSSDSETGVERASLRIPVWGLGAEGGSGQGDSLVASDPSMNFGTVAVGSSTTLTNYISNPTKDYVTIGKAITTGSYFQLVSPGLPVIIPPGQRAKFVYRFVPNRTGRLRGRISIWSSASASSSGPEASDESVTLTFRMGGVGAGSTGTIGDLGKLTVSSSPVAFGSILVGKTQKVSAAITNSGGSSVTVDQATVTGTGFSVSAISMPMTLAPNQSTTVSVSCTPKTAGSLSGNLTISSNASNGSVAVPLSATAVMPGDLLATAASLKFGTIAVGKAQTLPETLSNSGGASITLSQAAAGAGFTISGLSLPLTLNPGATTSFDVVFSPQAAGSSNVNLAIINDGPTPTLTIPLSGAGAAAAAGALTVTPVSFGSVPVGDASTQPATLTNSGSASVTVSQANLTSTAFTLSGLSMPLTVDVGQHFTFDVTFTPKAAGAASGNIALVSTASGTPSISLSGTGTAAGQFSVSPGSVAFGSVSVGASKQLAVTLNATGSSVTVTAASVNSPEFSLSGPTLPFTIQPGSTASFNLTFTPQSSGATTANVAFDTSASSTPVNESVSGTGAAAAAQHSVDLSWSASTSAVVGYNVYRGSKTGGPYAKLNSATDAALSYSDTGVQAGQTYFYTTTAVAGDGKESPNSNEVEAVIPTP